MATAALGISMGKGPGGLWTCRGGEPGTGPAVLPKGQGPTALGARAGSGALGTGRDGQGCWGLRGPEFWAQLVSLCSSFTELLREVAALSVAGRTLAQKRVS